MTGRERIVVHAIRSGRIDQELYSLSEHKHDGHRHGRLQPDISPLVYCRDIQQGHPGGHNCRDIHQIIINCRDYSFSILPKESVPYRDIETFMGYTVDESSGSDESGRKDKVPGTYTVRRLHVLSVHGTRKGHHQNNGHYQRQYLSHLPEYMFS